MYEMSCVSFLRGFYCFLLLLTTAVLQQKPNDFSSFIDTVEGIVATGLNKPNESNFYTALKILLHEVSRKSDSLERATNGHQFNGRGTLAN